MYAKISVVGLVKGNVRYEFVDNYIDWAEQGSLQPNYTIYEENRNHTQLRLGSNSFNCTCALVGKRLTYIPRSIVCVCCLLYTSRCV